MTRRPMRGINLDALHSIQARQDLYKKSGLTGDLSNDNYQSNTQPNQDQQQTQGYQPQDQYNQPQMVQQQNQSQYNQPQQSQAQVDNPLYAKLGMTPEMLEQRQQYDTSLTAILYYDQDEQYTPSQNQQANTNPYQNQQANTNPYQNQQGYEKDPGLYNQTQGGYNQMQGQNNQQNNQQGQGQGPQGPQGPQQNQQQYNPNQQQQQYNPNQQQQQYNPNQQQQQYNPNQQQQQYNPNQQQYNPQQQPQGKPVKKLGGPRGLTLNWKTYVMMAMIVLSGVMMFWRFFIM